MYRNASLFFSLLTFLTFSTLSCGGDATINSAESSSDQSESSNGINISVEDNDGESVNINIDTDDLSNNISEAMQQLSDAVSEAAEDNNNGEAVEVVNFRDLKAIIPERLLGMDRTEITGETNGVFGIKVSTAEAEFEEDDQRLSVSVIDGGGVGIAQLGAAAWTTVEVDRETSNGFERTTEIDGHKAFESYDGNTGKAELSLFYNNRFIISLEGRGLDEDDLRRALRRIDYEDLD